MKELKQTELKKLAKPPSADYIYDKKTLSDTKMALRKRFFIDILAN